MNPETSVINVIKSGKVLNQFPCSAYQVMSLSGIVQIQFKASRETVMILSHQYYDYIEIEEEGA